jgi:hypothetical protein
MILLHPSWTLSPLVPDAGPTKSVRTLRVTPEPSAGLTINDAPNGRLVLLMPPQRNEIDAATVLQA